MVRAAESGISEDQSVDSVMRRWPPTIRVFLAYRMLCVGCPVGPLHSLAEACALHGIEPVGFLRDLNQAADQADYDVGRSPSASKKSR